MIRGGTDYKSAPAEKSKKIKDKSKKIKVRHLQTNFNIFFKVDFYDYFPNILNLLSLAFYLLSLLRFLK